MPNPRVKDYSTPPRCKCRVDWLRLRIALGLTQRQMADLLFLSDSEISYLEAPPHKCPRTQTIMFLRYHLSKPEFVEKLKAAEYPHPYPEDLSNGTSSNLS